MKTLVEVTELFLVPSTILIGAFSVAKTEALKTGLSAVCTVVAALWMVCALATWGAAQEFQEKLLVCFPILFGLLFFFFTFVHARIWYKRVVKATHRKMKKELRKKNGQSTISADK